MLAWNDSKDSDRTHIAPLILIPVEINRYFDGRSNRYEYAATWREEDVQDNLCLAKKLERDFGSRLPLFDEEQTPEQYFAAVQQGVCTEPGWRVERQALLGFFSFHKHLMYMDIDPANWESNGKLTPDSIAGQVIWGQSSSGDSGEGDNRLYAGDYAIDDEPAAAEVVLATDADSSQHSALMDIAAGKNLVIEGPPGTGKSQTITNAIADAIHKGKTVLFVAEKLAALEVVQGKLTHLGLAEFCLELHSDAASPRKVFESLHHRLEANFKRPRELEVLNDELQRKKQLIADYLAACAKPVGPHNEPLHELLWRVIEQRARGQVALRSAQFDCDVSRITFEENSQLLEACAESMLEVKLPKHSPWWGFWPNRLNPNDCRPVEQRVEALQAIAAEVSSLAGDLEREFGQKTGEWIRARLGTETVIPALQSLAANAQQLSRVADLSRFLSADARTDAQRLCALLNESRQLAPKTQSLLLVDLAEGAKSAAQLRQTIDTDLAPLTSITTWGELGDVKSRLGSLLGALAEVKKITDEMNSQGIGEPRTLREYEPAEFLCKLARHPIVAERTDVPASFFYRSTVTALRNAQSESQTLLGLREKLDACFDLASLPDAESVQDITKCIRAHGTSWLRIFRGDYRTAKRKLAEFRRLSASKRPRQWVTDLEQLQSWLSRDEAFAKNNEYRNAMGDLFQSTETDWEQCKTLLSWATTAMKRGLDHAAASMLLQQRNVRNLRGSQASSARKLITAELSSRETLTALGYPPSTPPTEIPFTELASRATLLKSAIEQAQATARAFSLRDEQTLGKIRDACNVVERHDEITRQIADPQPWRALDDWYEAHDTDGEQLMRTVDFVEQLTHLELPTATEKALLSGQSVVENCNKLAECVLQAENHRVAWQAERAALEPIGTLNESWLAWQFRGKEADRTSVKLDALAGSIDDLPAWSAFCRAMEACNAQGLTSFTEAMLEDQIEPGNLAACYRYTVLERIAESGVWGSPTLGNFSRKTMEKARQRYQQLDRELLTVNRTLVAHRASQRRTESGTSRGRVGEYTEMGLILHEVQKQRRHCRIRDLLSRAGTSAQALKPCFMMSPLSVSQYLAPDGVEFDLVIMDEASQVKPEDAIGVLLRAKQIVVVGDPKQLPPTSFFDGGTEDVADEDATQFDNTESILEVAMKSFQPVRRLRWHYRSQHESLIQFSNDRFYDGDLVVFPSAAGAKGNLGLRYHYVEGGQFVGGCNPVEAEQVARAIAEHARTSPDETLGVGTFNKKQATLIQDWLDKLCEHDSGTREAVSRLNEYHEGIFVKNLENLQGDERDVMFISYTYGPDPASGRVMNRFGPVNGAYGWRRLNVLVTRARRRVEVFSSMNPSDILGGPAKGLGVNAMKDYLDFCRTGKLPDRGVASEREMESPFEEAVARVVQRLGLEVVPQVGVAGYFIDLGVRKPGDDDFLLGIECDGATYHSSRSARDRDRLREEVIRSRGWNLHRIWSTDWYLNQKHEEERLRQALID